MCIQFVQFQAFKINQILSICDSHYYINESKPSNENSFGFE